MVQEDGSPWLTTRSGRSRWRSFFKVVMYLICAFIAAVVTSSILRHFTGFTLQELMSGSPSSAILAHSALFLAVVLIPTGLSLLLWREPFSHSGWAIKGSGKLFTLGGALGALLLCSVMAVLWATGSWSAELAPLSTGAVIRLLFASLALWLIQSAQEEGLYRGYVLLQLSRSIGFWPAALILAIGFGAIHAGQPGATLLSITAAGLFGFVFSLSVLRTGSLWFAWGFHATWNFGQVFVFGLRNSGGTSDNSLVISQVVGNPLWTGGDAGPEGSLLILPVLIALAGFIHLRLRPPSEGGSIGSRGG